MFYNKYKFLNLDVIKKVALDDFEIRSKDIVIKRGGSQLNGFILYSEESTASRTVLYLHEKDFNIFTFLQLCKELICKLECEVILFPYSCYGIQDSKASFRDICSDNKAILDNLLNSSHYSEYIKGDFYVYGRCTGGSVAIQSIEPYQHLIKGMIVENTFSSLIDLVKKKWVGLIAQKALLGGDIDNVSEVKRLFLPIIFLLSKENEEIPFELCEKLAVAKGDATVRVFNFADHLNIYEFANKDYIRSLLSFFNNN